MTSSRLNSCDSALHPSGLLWLSAGSMAKNNVVNLACCQRSSAYAISLAEVLWWASLRQKALKNNHWDGPPRWDLSMQLPPWSTHQTAKARWSVAPVIMFLSGLRIKAVHESGSHWVTHMSNPWERFEDSDSRVQVFMDPSFPRVRVSRVKSWVTCMKNVC